MGMGAQLFPWGQGSAGPRHPNQTVQMLPSWLDVGDDTSPAQAGPGSNRNPGPLYVPGRTQPAGVGDAGAGGSGKAESSALGTCMAVGRTEGLGDTRGMWPGTTWTGAAGPPRCCLGAPEQRFHLGFGPQIPLRCGCGLKSLLGTYRGKTQSTPKAQLRGRRDPAFPKLTKKLISITIKVSQSGFDYTP